MEKLARRTAMAERQVARQLKKEAVKDKMPRLPPKYIRKEVNYHMAMARTARREDWEMGPLAPQRDVPTTSLPRYRHPLKHALFREARGIPAPVWGAVNKEISRPSFKLSDKVREERWKWAGGSQHPNIVAGDRVVVVEGVHKGMIGKIKDINYENASVEIEGFGDVNISIPNFIPTDGETIVATSSAFPVSAVRLVHPIKDPNTGLTRDVIIKQLVRHNFFHDRHTRHSSWQRLVPGLNVTIPWPQTPPMEHTEHECDTKRQDLEKRSFVPMLLKAPMPESVLDELRNKYSIFRTRHTDEYVAKKEAEEAAKRDRLGMTLTMRTPLQELNKKLRDARRARGQPVLTEEMLAKIGEVMARSRAEAMAAAGISDVPTPAPPAASPPDASAPVESLEDSSSNFPTPPPPLPSTIETSPPPS